jgi:hypothetical protein
MSTTPAHPVERLQALLIDHLLPGADARRRLHCVLAVTVEAERVALLLNDDQDAALAGWLAQMLDRLAE